jgi:flavin-dependent dehydrogenase
MEQAKDAFDCDVLVVGGGPGGSTAATLLARRGHRVVQLEKDRHPRFHIGESLLPCNLPIMEALGVLEKTHAIGVVKRGADFPSGSAGEYQTFRFERALGDSPPYAFQVKREDFDRMLFEHARENGVDTHESTKVESVSVDGVGRVVAESRDASGATRTWRARYLVDATGRDTLVGSALKIKRKNDAHQSAALFAHFRNVEMRPGDDAGNISIYRFAHGWCWFIPLPDGLMSVGCVCVPEYLKLRRGRTETFLIDTLKQMPDAWARLEKAEIVGSVRVAGNYSYACDRMAGPGWIMVGDAYAFVDPVFSSGVYLAMHSAALGADVVDASLADPSREATLQRAFAQRIQRGIAVFSWFIYRFNSPIMRKLFAKPRNVFRVEEGVISMLAGDVFDSAPVHRRLHLFKVIYAIGGALNLRGFFADLRERRRQARYALETPGDA